MNAASCDPPAISVVICAHNPRNDYLSRTLDSIRNQSLPTDRWELLLIDNASTQPLDETVDLGWHAHARVIREEQLGLTPARLRGIDESAGRLIIFVDDDNILAPNYLETALRIEQHWPSIGAWSGRVDPEFEVPPPEWTRKYWPMLAIRQIERSFWSNIIDLHEANPVGAGMCVRREAAKTYAAEVRTNACRRALDRRGESLSSAGDLDLAFMTCASGLGMGIFRELQLTHLIPERRLSLDYLAKLMEEGVRSSTILMSLYRETGMEPPRRLLGLRTWLASWKLPYEDRVLTRARIRGYLRALKEITPAPIAAKNVTPAPTKSHREPEIARAGPPEAQDM